MQRPKQTLCSGSTLPKPKPFSNSHIFFTHFFHTNHFPHFPLPHHISILNPPPFYKEMNKLMQVPPQHHLSADTPSGCFTDLFHCLLCRGTVSTRSSNGSPTPHSTSVSKKFGGYLGNDDQGIQVGNVLPECDRGEVQLPIVARLMGLETPVDRTWKPRVIDDSVKRSRSVNYVDCLFDSRPEQGAGLLHRRVKTSLSFGELPVGDFLVVCLESAKNKAQCDSRVKDAQKARSESKTERRKDKGRILSEGRNRTSRTTNACIKSESPREFEQTRHLRVGVKSSQGITTNVEQTDRLKAGTSCERTTNRRTARSAWQQKNDYYKKPHAVESQSRRKATQKDVNTPLKSKSKKERKDMNTPSNLVSHDSSVSDRLFSNATHRCRIKTRSRNEKPRIEERRSSRKSRIADQGAGTFGELMMMKKIKDMTEQDLEKVRWNCGNEAGFLYREYLCMVIELGIFDELVKQIVHGLASSCDV